MSTSAVIQNYKLNLNSNKTKYKYYMKDFNENWKINSNFVLPWTTKPVGVKFFNYASLESWINKLSLMYGLLW